MQLSAGGEADNNIMYRFKFSLLPCLSHFYLQFLYLCLLFFWEWSIVDAYYLFVVLSVFFILLGHLSFGLKIKKVEVQLNKEIPMKKKLLANIFYNKNITSASNCCQCLELHVMASLVVMPGFLASRAGLICAMNLKNGVNGRLGLSIPNFCSAVFLV